MPTNYDPVPTYHATYPLPVDGEPAVANSVNSPMGDLADGLCYVAEPMALGGTIILGGELEFSANLVTFSGGIDVRTQPSFFHSDVTFNEDVVLGSSAADAITVTGTLTVNSAANFTGNVRLGDTDADALTVFASASFRGANTFLGELIVDSSTTFECNGNATFEGDVQIGSTGAADSLNVYSNTLFHRDVTIGDDSGSETFTVNSSTNFQDTVSFDNDVTISAGNDLIVGGRATFTDDVTLGNGSGDAVNILGSCTISNLSARMGFTSPGRVPLKLSQGPNSNTTIEPAETNAVYVPEITSNRSYTLSDTDVSDGDYIDISLETAGSNELRLLNPAGTFTIHTLTEETGVRVVWASGAWKVMRLA